MKKIIFTFTLLFIATAAFCQKNDSTYCDITCNDNVFKKQSFDIAIDYGSGYQALPNLPFIKDHTQLLNFMAKNGWRLVSAYAETVGGTMNGDGHVQTSLTHFIMEKK
jgi:hypothetical protein